MDMTTFLMLVILLMAHDCGDACESVDNFFYKRNSIQVDPWLALKILASDDFVL
jgi:hypothetical protein